MSSALAEVVAAKASVAEAIGRAEGAEAVQRLAEAQKEAAARRADDEAERASGAL